MAHNCLLLIVARIFLVAPVVGAIGTDANPVIAHCVAVAVFGTVVVIGASFYCQTVIETRRRCSTDNIDHTVHGVRAVQRGGWTPNDLYAAGLFEVGIK